MLWPKDIITFRSNYTCYKETIVCIINCLSNLSSMYMFTKDWGFPFICIVKKLQSRYVYQLLLFFLPSIHNLDYVFCSKKPTHTTSCGSCYILPMLTYPMEFLGLSVPASFKQIGLQRTTDWYHKMDKACFIIRRQPEIPFGIRSFLLSCHYGNY